MPRSELGVHRHLRNETFGALLLFAVGLGLIAFAAHALLVAARSDGRCPRASSVGVERCSVSLHSAAGAACAVGGGPGMRTITFVFSLFTLLLLPAADARADEVADAIAEVKQLAKEYDTGGGAARRLAELAKLDDPRVTKCLLDLTRCRLEVVAIAAYVGLSSRDEPRVLKLLKVRAGDKSLAEEHADVYAALLDALVVRVDPSCLDVLSTVVQRYLSTNAEFSTRAIRAYSRVRQKSVIDQLIKWLGQSESGSGTGTAETLAPEARACRVRARAELLLRLKVATGVERADFDAWRDWWKENERRFEFPELTAEQSGQ